MKRLVTLLLAVLAVASASCEAAVSSTLDSVGCEQANVVGPPACPGGNVCAAGRCVACASVERCGDGIDNDCDGHVDQGCAHAGGAGGGFGLGGSAGLTGHGGAAGNGGIAGSAPAIGFGGSGGGNAGSGGAIGEGGTTTTNPGGSGGATAGSSNGGQVTAGAGGDAGSGGDAGGGGGGGTVALGETCVPGDVCETGATCLDWVALGEMMSGAICTKPCCTSSDCGAALTAVCFPAANGAGMCVPGATYERGNIGAQKLGEACGDGGPFCRSGSCEAGFCNDVCCKDTNCAGTATPKCIKKYLTPTAPSVIRYGYECGVEKGTRDYADPSSGCTQDSSCKSYACDLDAGVVLGTFCAKDCCTSSECGSVVVPLFGTYTIACVYAPSKDGFVRSCAKASASWGAGLLGDPCSVDGDCQTDKCITDGSTGYCSDACCKEDDCGGGMFHCKPSETTSGIAVFLCLK